MSDLVQRVAATFRDRHLLRAGQRLLVAVSGGVDSMVLLEVLHRLAGPQRWKLAVAHFNHSLRGRASDADERLVKRAAQRLQLPFIAERGKIRAAAVSKGISVEMAAREARHGFLAATALKHGIKTIALAHHADDQVELFFLRLLRGAGSRGLGGMNSTGPSPADKRVRLIRPLLDCRKEELMEFARGEGIRYREDASNVSVEILRNRVRHELLPLLKRHYQPALERVVTRQMEILAAESELLDGWAEDWRRTRSPKFSALAVALQRRVLQRELGALGVSVDFDSLEKLREEPQRPLCLSGQWNVVHDGCGMVHRIAIGSASFEGSRLEVALAEGKGQGSFAGLEWRWELRAGGRERPTFSAGAEWFDADRVGTSVALRHWQPGDRFQPSGMEHPVKLQDLFTNLKIPRERRRRLVVATTAGGEVWWVEGLRIAERFKLSAKTRRRLWWRWRRKE